MNKKLGFTLVELLVVITIIMVITTSGTIYFFKFLDSRGIKNDINFIKNNINNLDSEVKNYEIFDYELNFSSGSKGYFYYVNKFDIAYSQNMKLDFNTGIGIIKTDTSMTGGIRILKVYKKYKLFLERVLIPNGTYTGSFIDSSYYNIEGSINGNILNEIGIKYFTKDNIIKNGNNYLILSTISKNIDKFITCANLIVKNIGGKKIILCGGIQWSQAYLFFIKNGREDFIEIN